MKNLYMVLTTLMLFATFGCQVDSPINNDLSTETWKCFDSIYQNQVLIILIGKKDPQDQDYGEVLADGISHTARFRIEGLERRWDFGIFFDYSFIIQPDGTGLYYDFSSAKLGESVKPKQFYKCTSS